MAQHAYGQYYAPPPPPPQAQQNLQFYGGEQAGFYGGSVAPAYGNMGVSGSIQSGGGATGAGPQGWLAAFGTGGFEGEPPLLEELGINFPHIRSKTMTVLNPLRTVDEHIMDDADLYGPLMFYFLLGVFLFISGKPQFGYIYGLALLGSTSVYVLLNLMSPSGIDAHRVASVLGYCLLPMVCVSAVSVTFSLDRAWGYFLAALSVSWCTYAASGIFVAVLRMTEQRFLVAYPISLLYSCFALLSIFSAS
ncbi:Yip1-domain-containing protein [Exidia glandulosa HHB12029]|uniref:Protein YIP n=1 Tax=Exidia glandulosa HHB12029 TaxID=1314781 RepID=A0A165PAN3_EXIGL|nr:Yip1-domain-containing protein [Exidia glandulosa HHB12029]